MMGDTFIRYIPHPPIDKSTTSMCLQVIIIQSPWVINSITFFRKSKTGWTSSNLSFFRPS